MIHWRRPKEKNGKIKATWAIVQFYILLFESIWLQINKKIQKRFELQNRKHTKSSTRKFTKQGWSLLWKKRESNSNLTSHPDHPMRKKRCGRWSCPESFLFPTHKSNTFEFTGFFSLYISYMKIVVFTLFTFK